MATSGSGAGCSDVDPDEGRAIRAAEARTAVVLDPEPLWCDAVVGILARLEIAVAGTATSARAALALIEEAQPDLLVMELSLDDDDEMDGFACLAKAHRIQESLRCVVLSDGDAPGRIITAFRSGACAYVLKTAEPEELAVAVRQVFRRSLFFPPSREAVATTAEHARNESLLTSRELEILELVAAGGPSAQIASRLWVTEQTVKFHLSNIYRKLGVSNRTEASRWAFEHGFVGVAGPGAPVESAPDRQPTRPKPLE